jgi:hypothetical protein
VERNPTTLTARTHHFPQTTTSHQQSIIRPQYSNGSNAQQNLKLQKYLNWQNQFN